MSRVLGDLNRTVADAIIDPMGTDLQSLRQLVRPQIPFNDMRLAQLVLMDDPVLFADAGHGGRQKDVASGGTVTRLGQVCGNVLVRVADLKDRGLLASTLVVCQGEFGRTPRINGNSGRDHWPASWSAVLAGGGIRGGQALGSTSDDGTEVTHHPCAVPDLIATVCEVVGIDSRKQNLSNVSRPIRIADPDAQPITELL